MTTPTYTHIFSGNTRKMVPLSEAPTALKDKEFMLLGICLVDENKVVFDKHGMPSYSHDGWSYVHVQHGWLCAGAGGPNSMRVLNLNNQKEYIQ